jgi:hypothetical protein
MIEPIVKILLAAAAGLTIGWVGCENVYRRKHAEITVNALRQQTAPASSPDTIQRQLRQIRGVLNDAHKHILAVSKGLKKPVS